MNLDHKLLNGAGSHRPRPKIPTFSERTTERETETLKETYITLQEYTYRYLSTHINVSFCVISVSLLLIKFPPFHDFVSSSDLSLSLCKMKVRYVLYKPKEEKSPDNDDEEEEVSVSSVQKQK